MGGFEDSNRYNALTDDYVDEIYSAHSCIQAMHTDVGAILLKNGWGGRVGEGGGEGFFYQNCTFWFQNLLFEVISQPFGIIFRPGNS